MINCGRQTETPSAYYRLKRTPKTMAIAGIVSPAEAILRKVLDDRDQVVMWTLPIFELYCHGSLTERKN